MSFLHVSSFVFVVLQVLACFGQQTLREAADKKGIWMGAALNYNDLHNDQTYYTMGGEQYSLVTAENGCKWSATEPNYNEFDFTQCDYVYNYSASHNMTFRGHNLCWGEYNPSWLTNGGYSPSQLEDILSTHITTVMDHYGTNAYCWDVVNEAVSDNPSQGTFKTNVWYPAIPNYVQFAFETARKAQPNVKLFYNDYDIVSADGWMQQKSDAVYNLTKTLKQQGIIDGIGIQCHMDLGGGWYPLDVNGITKNFQRYQDLGLEIHVTEMDVGCGYYDNNSGQEVACQSFTNTLNEEQGSMYQDLLKICLQFPNCKNFESWGYTDRYTWRGSNMYPLPFDYNYNPKDAVNDMLDTLNS